MFDNVLKFFKKFSKEEKKESKDTAKERLHLVLMQDRANVSADFMELMKQEIIEVIKKYIDVDENSIDVKLTNKVNGDGTTGVPMLYANIPIMSVKDDAKQVKIERNLQSKDEVKEESQKEENKEVKVEDNKIEEQNEKKAEEVIEEQAEIEKVENIVEENKQEEKTEEVIEIQEENKEDKEEKLESNEDLSKTEG